MKRVEAAHHRWLRKILGIIWKDKIRNDARQQHLVPCSQNVEKQQDGILHGLIAFIALSCSSTLAA